MYTHTILAFILLFTSLNCRPRYISHVSISGYADQVDADLGVHSLTFTMDKSKVKYGQIYGVPVYKIQLNKCNVQIKDKQYPDWFAAYVNIPSSCSDRAITKALESNGADFIFISHDEMDENRPNLLPHNIEVPVFELDGNENRRFLSELKNAGDGATLTISMPYPKSKEGVVNFELYYTPTNMRSYKYIHELNRVLTILQKQANFEPFLVLFSNLQNPNSRNCIGGGKYCAPDPDNQGEETGRDVVLEMLRQKCIYKLSAEDWFQYMELYKDGCFNSINDKCSKKLIKSTYLKPDKVEKCISESNLQKEGFDPNSMENSILEREMEKLRSNHEMSFPALYINGQKFEGHVQKNEILIRACDTFDFKPQACSEVELEYSGQRMSLKWSILIYVYILGCGLMLIATVCVCLAKRSAAREVNYEVKKSVANYFALKESEGLK